MKKRHIFCAPLHILGKYLWKGASVMEEREEVQDIDDFIFAEQEHHPSEK